MKTKFYHQQLAPWIDDPEALTQSIISIEVVADLDMNEPYSNAVLLSGRGRTSEDIRKLNEIASSENKTLKTVKRVKSIRINQSKPGKFENGSILDIPPQLYHKIQQETEKAFEQLPEEITYEKYMEYVFENC